MAYPYLSGYLSISKDGECYEVFNGCRTSQNFHRAREWKLARPDQMWEGCCCWIWDNFCEEDPWYDPNIPASTEVAGAFIDPPDLNGHGFYLEPSRSVRVLEDGGPLEMYLTFSVLSGTPGGERHFMEWLQQTLIDSCDPCGYLELNVALECPCDPTPCEIGSSMEGLPAPTFIADQAEGDWCGRITPDSVGGNVFQEVGVRQLLRAKYKGLEELGETLSLCSGNSYKLNFEVFSKDWYTPPGFVCELTSKDCEAECGDNDLYRLCREPVEHPCETLKPSRFATQVTRLSSFNNGTADGLIAREGRWSRPDKVSWEACIVDAMPEGKEAVPCLRVTNTTGDVINNFRVMIWKEIVGAPPPNSVEGFGLYKDVCTVYEKRFSSARPDATINVNLLGEATECCYSKSFEYEGYENNAHGTLGCGNRYWIALETACGVEGLNVEVYMSYREAI